MGWKWFISRLVLPVRWGASADYEDVDFVSVTEQTIVLLTRAGLYDSLSGESK